MKVRQLVFGAILAVLLTSVAGAATSARSNGQVECHKVKASGVGQDLGGGNTTATISHGGVLNGTTAAHFDITGSPPVFTIEGTVLFTTKKGTLTVGPTGTFNVSTGAFDASGPLTGGTGRFEEATGTLSFSGVEDLSTGVFTETIKGRICRAGDDGGDD